MTDQSGKPVRRLRLVLDNALDSIAEGHRAIAQFFGRSTIDPSILARLDVVFEEVIANIVRHGFSPGEPHAILVEVTETPETIALSVEDDGRPFNPLSVAPRKTAAALADVEIGGLGIPLLRAYAQSLAYEEVPAARRYAPFENGESARNRLTLTIARR